VVARSPRRVHTLPLEKPSLCLFRRRIQSKSAWILVELSEIFRTWVTSSQFVTNLILEHPTEGELVLDILTEHRVGGVEFLPRIVG
jgi:hypothetical protein